MEARPKTAMAAREMRRRGVRMVPSIETMRRLRMVRRKRSAQAERLKSQRGVPGKRRQ